jgi:hypothetical protein
MCKDYGKSDLGASVKIRHLTSQYAMLCELYIATKLMVVIVLVV